MRNSDFHFLLSLGSCNHELFIDKNIENNLTYILTSLTNEFLSMMCTYKKKVGSLEFCFFFDKLSMTNKSSRKWQQWSFKLIASHHFGQGQVLLLVPEKKNILKLSGISKNQPHREPFIVTFFNRILGPFLTWFHIST